MRGRLVSSSAVSYVNEIIERGIRERASDIHISFDVDEGMEIKYRVDGILREAEKLYSKVEKRLLEKNIVEIISRIKILANMNVAEKRKPQDGSFSFLFNKLKASIAKGVSTPNNVAII